MRSGFAKNDRASLAELRDRSLCRQQRAFEIAGMRGRGFAARHDRTR